MYNFLVKKGQLVALVIGLVSIVIIVMTISSGLSNGGYTMSDDLNQVLKTNPEADFSFFNIVGVMPIILTGACLLIIAGFGIWQLITNFKSSMKFLIVIAVLAGLFFILYSMASVESAGRLGELHDKFNISDNVSKLISGGISTTIYMAIAAFALLVIGEIINLFR